MLKSVQLRHHSLFQVSTLTTFKYKPNDRTNCIKTHIRKHIECGNICLCQSLPLLRSVHHSRFFTTGNVLMGSASRIAFTITSHGLSKLQADDLVLRLNSQERATLLAALQQYQNKFVKSGAEEETKEPKPTSRQLLKVAVANGIPFVGFGFLDNFFMLLFGDSIDMYLGSALCFSTMTAAALGNTLSDVLGIGTAFYVERFAIRIGFQSPQLSPAQLDMNTTRTASNLGRVLGVTIGCILGMFPLLIPKSSNKTESIPKTQSKTI